MNKTLGFLRDSSVNWIEMGDFPRFQVWILIQHDSTTKNTNFANELTIKIMFPYTF